MSAVLYDAMERAVKALKAHPELSPSITVSMTEDGLWVTPYIMGAPMQALLAWHEALKEPERDYEVTTSDAGNYTRVTVRGLLDDVPVIAQTVTFQDVTGQRGKVSLAELKKLAKNEEPLVPVT